jgi:hypothetical protein
MQKIKEGVFNVSKGIVFVLKQGGKTSKRKN